MIFQPVAACFPKDFLSAMMTRGLLTELYYHDTQLNQLLIVASCLFHSLTEHDEQVKKACTPQQIRKVIEHRVVTKLMRAYYAHVMSIILTEWGRYGIIAAKNNCFYDSILLRILDTKGCSQVRLQWMNKEYHEVAEKKFLPWLARVMREQYDAFLFDGTCSASCIANSRWFARDFATWMIDNPITFQDVVTNEETVRALFVPERLEVEQEILHQKGIMQSLETYLGASFFTDIKQLHKKVESVWQWLAQKEKGVMRITRKMHDYHNSLREDETHSIFQRAVCKAMIDNMETIDDFDKSALLVPQIMWRRLLSDLGSDELFALNNGIIKYLSSGPYTLRRHGNWVPVDISSINDYFRNYHLLKMWPPRGGFKERVLAGWQNQEQKKQDEQDAKSKKLQEDQESIARVQQYKREKKERDTIKINANLAQQREQAPILRAQQAERKAAVRARAAEEKKDATKERKKSEAAAKAKMQELHLKHKNVHKKLEFLKARVAALEIYQASHPEQVRHADERLAADTISIEQALSPNTQTAGDEYQDVQKGVEDATRTAAEIKQAEECYHGSVNPLRTQVSPTSGYVQADAITLSLEGVTLKRVNAGIAIVHLSRMMMLDAWKGRNMQAPLKDGLLYTPKFRELYLQINDWYLENYYHQQDGLMRGQPASQAYQINSEWLVDEITQLINRYLYERSMTVSPAIYVALIELVYSAVCGDVVYGDMATWYPEILQRVQGYNRDALQTIINNPTEIVRLFWGVQAFNGYSLEGYMAQQLRDICVELGK